DARFRALVLSRRVDEPLDHVRLGARRGAAEKARLGVHGRRRLLHEPRHADGRTPDEPAEPHAFPGLEPHLWRHFQRAPAQLGVLPYAPGGSGDLIFRTIQQGMEKRLGQSMVLDFRTGGAGLIGVREVVKSAPDSYTLLFGPTNNFVIDQHLHKALGYDPLQALVPVTVVADTPYLLVVSAATPATSYAEFAAYARANKGKLNYASPGPATVPHLSGFMLNE